MFIIIIVTLKEVVEAWSINIRLFFVVFLYKDMHCVYLCSDTKYDVFDVIIHLRCFSCKEIIYCIHLETGII